MIKIRKQAYDVTNFLDDHPGGDEVLLQVAGTDKNLINYTCL